MTVTASGAITFSDIMNEFNSGGGQSNIKLGDYISRHPDKWGSDPISTTVLVAWDGYRFTLDGSVPTGTSGYWTYDGKLRVFFALNNTCTLPFYVATSNNTTGSDLCSGVSNNGSVYNASSNYHLGSYTFVIVEVETAAGGTSEWPEVTKVFHINTNQQMLTGSGGSNVNINVLSLPDTNRLVTRNRPWVDYAFPSALNGGSEDTIALGNQNASYSSVANTIGILKNGDSMTVWYTTASLPDARSTGTQVYAYSPLMYPVTYSGTGFAQNWTGGSSGWLYWDTWGGSGTNYINGSGSHANTASGVADCIRGGPSSATGAGGTGSTSGWTTSWAGSGSSLALNLTNNTGTDYVMTTYQNSSVSGFSTFNFQYLDNSSNPQYTSSRNPHWGSNPRGDHYGQNFYPYLRFAKKTNTNTSGGDTNVLMYCGGSYNRSQVISMIKTYINTAGGSGTSTTYPGTQTGANTKTSWYTFDAYEPTTGTLRIRWASNVGGTFEAGSNAEYTNADVTPSWSTALGAVSATPTVTYSTGTYDLTDNGAVNNKKLNLNISAYYGTRNLGTDGG
jgi:hypothetical protein